MGASPKLWSRFVWFIVISLCFIWSNFVCTKLTRINIANINEIAWSKQNIWSHYDVVISPKIKHNKTTHISWAIIKRISKHRLLGGGISTYHACIEAMFWVAQVCVSDVDNMYTVRVLINYKIVYHYNDVIMGAIASQITSLMIVYSTVYSCTDQRKQQSSASLAFVRGIHRGPVNSPHKWPVTRKMFPFDYVIML